MVRRPRAALALLAALVLAAAAPGTMQAADTGPLDARVAATPLNQNLLRNAGFETAGTKGSIPGWKAEGGVKVERFGTRTWPDAAYGRRWGGGKRYLTCTRSPGLVRQTVAFSRAEGQNFRVKARLVADYGGWSGHSIRLTLRVKGPGIDRADQTLERLDVTNSYKRVVANLFVPPGTEQLVATVELVGSGGRCRMVADTIKMEIFRP